MTGEPGEVPLRAIDPSDREAIRAWMKAHRHHGGDPHRTYPKTTQEFALLQRMRLLQSLTSEDER